MKVNRQSLFVIGADAARSVMAGEGAWLGQRLDGGDEPLLQEIGRRYGLLAGCSPQALRVRLPSGRSQVFGRGEPAVGVTAVTPAGMAALASFDELALAEAYMNGDIDLTGDPLGHFAFRDVLSDRHPLQYLWSAYVRPKLLGQVASDKHWIKSHYDVPPEFFELWLDRSIRGYSHAFFEGDDEALEPAMERKFQFALDAVAARPGDRVLDIGGGWGSMVQYGGERGINVTSITISDESARYIGRLISERGLPCKVIKEHLLDYRPAERFDAIVNLGVTEHLPDYERTIAAYVRLLAPGKKMYLDAYSGDRFGMGAFVTKWVFEGNTSPWCLHEYLEVLSRTELEVLHLQNDRHNYYLTCKKWAENLDRAADQVRARWGEHLYRRFRMYLWCSAYAFLEGTLDAHRMVLSLPTDQPGRRMRNPSGRRRRLV
jgi:cyclopropane-fatty-acyl-phospholipid synthase